MLSEMDDYPLHQIAEPIRFLETSDRNFNDRYYFNMHNCSDEFFVVAGFGQYPNLGTQDAFFALRFDQEQVVLRSSRELGDRADLTCGPFRIEILEGLRRLRLVIDANDHGLEGDMIFTGAQQPTLEPRQYERKNGRVLWDVLRFGQTGFYEGAFRYKGRAFRLDGKTARGFRDRSWGIRPLGEPEPKGIQAKSPPNMMWLYTVAQFDDFTLMLKVHEENDGTRHMEEATRIWNDPAKGVDHFGPLDYTVEFDSERRFIKRVRLRCTGRGGEELDVRVEQLMPLFLQQGTGYSDSPEWRNGMYQGALKTELVAFDLVGDRDKLNGYIDAAARFTLDGQVGHGLLEYGFVGRFDPAGVTGPGYWNSATK